MQQLLIIPDRLFLNAYIMLRTRELREIAGFANLSLVNQTLKIKEKWSISMLPSTAFSSIFFLCYKSQNEGIAKGIHNGSPVQA